MLPSIDRPHVDVHLDLRGNYGMDGSASRVPPCAQRGEVAPSYGDGGVMGSTDAVAHDPSVGV